MTPLLFVLLTSLFSDGAVLTRSQIECRDLLELALERSAELPQNSRVNMKQPNARKKIDGGCLLENRHLDFDAESGSPTAGTADHQQLRSIWKSVSNHPVASLCYLADYDPTGNIGFCFGRSMAVHLQTVVDGLDDVDVRKVFIEGEFRNPVAGEDVWHYHAVTAIRAFDGVWYAIDPRLEGPVPITQWAGHWTAFAVNDVRFLICQADTLWPLGTSYEDYFREIRTRTLAPGSPGAYTFVYLDALARNYLGELRSLAAKEGTTENLLLPQR